MHKGNGINLLPRPLGTNHLKAGVLEVIMCSIGLHTGRGFDFVKNRPAIDGLQRIRTSKEAFFRLEDPLEVCIPSLGILEKLPNVLLDLVALTRQLLKEDGKLAVRVFIRGGQKQPKRFRAIQVLDEVRLR